MSVTSEELFARLSTAVQEDDFDTFAVLLIQYKGAWRKILSLQNDRGETLLQQTVRYCRGSMYSCLCDFYVSISQKINCGPLEGSVVQDPDLRANILWDFFKTPTVTSNNDNTQQLTPSQDGP